MFSDSHTHILFTKEKIDNAESMIASLKQEGFRFLMDIGTEPGDLKKRVDCVGGISKGEIPHFIHFAAGLWPHATSIENATSSLKMLEDDIKMGLNIAKEMAKDSKDAPFFALGECGLDRYWNGLDAPMQKEGGSLDIEGEEHLFMEQIRIAKKYNLALIIHSRSAYIDTLKCIDKVGYHKGVIHCFSYGIEEAKSFLERGWYISFPGNITFAKTKTAIEKTQALVSSIPLHHLLLETDAPYMSPVPLRGQTNTSLNIKHTYKKASEFLGISVERLCDVVYQNCVSLFAI